MPPSPHLPLHLRQIPLSTTHQNPAFRSPCQGKFLLLLLGRFPSMQVIRLMTPLCLRMRAQFPRSPPRSHNPSAMQGPATTPPASQHTSSAKLCLSAPTETAVGPHASHASTLQAQSSLQVSSTALQAYQLEALRACLETLMAASWPAQSGTRASVQPCSPNSGYYNFGARASDASSLTAVTRSCPRSADSSTRSCVNFPSRQP